MQLRWGDREMGTAILCIECSQVAGLIQKSVELLESIHPDDKISTGTKLQVKLVTQTKAYRTVLNFRGSLVFNCSQNYLNEIFKNSYSRKFSAIRYVQTANVLSGYSFMKNAHRQSALLGTSTSSSL